MQINGVKYSDNSEKVNNKVTFKGNRFSDIFDQVNIEKNMNDIMNKHNVHFHRFTDDGLNPDNREIDNVIISDSTFKKMSKDYGLRSKVLKHLEAVSSREWKDVLKNLMPPVKNAGVFIREDGSAVYWIEADKNKIDNNKTEQEEQTGGRQAYSVFQNINIMPDYKNGVITEHVPELLVKKYLKNKE